jgi:hypothetical protein
MTANTTPRYNIDTATLLVEINVSVWTARKLDRSTTDEVVTSKSAAAKDAARVNKNLLAGRPELDVITKHVGEARTYVYTHTLPWSDSGLRLLPSAQFLKFNERVRDFEDTFATLVQDFVTVYPTLITAQAMALGDMFRRDEYPSADELKHKFAFRVGYMPVPTAGDFRVDIGNEAQRDLQEQLTRLADERVERAVGDVKLRLADHLRRMSDRLTTDYVAGEPKQRRFHDTLVQGAYDLCDLLRTLNVTEDRDLESARRALEGALSGASAEDLRKDHAARDDVKKQVDALLGKFQW